LLCALTASAVSYATPYKGSGRGFIHTTLHNSQSHSSIGSSTVLAQAPVAAISSVNSSRGISSSNVSVTRVQSGIYTSASSISGGVTTYDSGHSGRKVRKSPVHPGNPDDDECPGCIYGDDGTCIICGHDPMDGLDDDGECSGHCHGECDEDGCHCVPLEFNCAVALFMTVLAAAYALYKRRASHRTVMSVMVARCSRD